MAGVRPLKPSGKVQAPDLPVERLRRNTNSDREDSAGLERTDARPATDETSGSGQVLFVRPGLQNKNIRRLKRGEITIEDELDLHGLRRHEAEDALEEFVARALSRGQRCITVIHGKGYRSADGTGVLKPLTIGFFRELEAVQAFCSALPRDGGTGAIYVLLKRQKS